MSSYKGPLMSKPQAPLPIRIGEMVSPKLVTMLREVFPRGPYTPSDPMGEVMHKEGQQSLINYIESCVVLASKKDDQ